MDPEAIRPIQPMVAVARFPSSRAQGYVNLFLGPVVCSTGSYYYSLTVCPSLGINVVGRVELEN